MSYNVSCLKEGVVIKVKFAIVGSGKIVELFLDAVSRMKGIELFAFYSRSETTVNQFKEKYGFKVGFTSLEAMLSHPEIDAVYIASPNSLHYEQTMMALHNGKHVLVEKPIASCATEAKAMFNLAEKQGLVLMEALRTVVLPNYSIIKQYLPTLGKLRSYSAHFSQYSSRYDAFLKGNVANAFNVKFSGGALMDLGVYCLGPMVDLFGMPEKVNAQGTLLSGGIDGQGQGIFMYDGFLASVQYSKITSASTPTIIQGELGAITIDKIQSISEVIIRYLDGKTIKVSEVQCANDMVYEIEVFLNGMKHKLSDSFRERSLHVMQLTDEMRRQIGVVFPADAPEYEG